jgi:hypothetical protein
MHIERVPNRNSPPAVLLRQSYREGGKVRKRTLANLSKLPTEAVEGLKILLKGGTAINQLEDAFEITRSRPHGHVAVVLGTLRKLELDHRFGLKRVVFVGDRGLITEARINEQLKNIEGLDWITALRAPQIRQLVEQEYLQLSLFDQLSLAEIQSPDYPGERLIACRNPMLAAEALRDSVVSPAPRSQSAKSKVQKKRTATDFPVHSFQRLLKDLATIVKNRVQAKLPGTPVTFDKITCPTPLQQKAFDLLGVSYLL